ncbi:putative RadC-like protein, partial [Escherichia coli PA34]
HYENYHPW